MCTFWGIIQEMIINTKEKAESLISWVAVLKIGWGLSVSTCIWLNEWITDWGLGQEIDIWSSDAIDISQSKYYSPDEEHWWIECIYKNIKYTLSWEEIAFLRGKILNFVDELSKWEWCQIEFWIKWGEFILLQKNKIKK